MCNGEFPGLGEESDDVRSDGLSVHRYWIERRWSEASAFILWIMFNPSTATILYDNTDRAVPLCKARTKQLAVQLDLSIGAMRVVNLFSRRATRTDSKAEQWGKGTSLHHPDWIGEENDGHIREQTRQAVLTVVGWGPALLQRHKAEWRAARVEKMLCDPWCLDVNADGHPYYAGPRGAATTALAVPLSVARERRPIARE
jgi:hypothetical protein